MNKAELIKALKQLKGQTESLDCWGCGYEHSCTTRGCAIIRKAAEELEKSETPKLRIGDSVYFVLLDDAEWRISEEKVVEVGKNGFFLSQVSGEMQPNEYIPYSEIGEEWFLKKEEAEEKVNRLKKGNK